jgi:hypothetical protein
MFTTDDLKKRDNKLYGSNRKVQCDFLGCPTRLTSTGFYPADSEGWMRDVIYHRDTKDSMITHEFFFCCWEHREYHALSFRNNKEEDSFHFCG